LDQAPCQTFCIPRLIEVNREIFANRHLPKIFEIGANDWNSVAARQVGNAAAPG